MRVPPQANHRRLMPSPGIHMQCLFSYEQSRTELCINLRSTYGIKSGVDQGYSPLSARAPSMIFVPLEIPCQGMQEHEASIWKKKSSTSFPTTNSANLLKWPFNCLCCQCAVGLEISPDPMSLKSDIDRANGGGISKIQGLVRLKPDANVRFSDII